MSDQDNNEKTTSGEASSIMDTDNVNTSNVYADNAVIDNNEKTTRGKTSSIVYTDNIIIRECAEPSWYILKSIFPNQEKRTVRSLVIALTQNHILDKLVEIFTPKEDILVLGNDTNTTKQETFYPGYIFVAFDIQDSSELISVSSLLMKDKNRLATVHAKEIERIKQQMTQSTETPKTTTGLEVGQHVIVTEGSCKDMTGIIDKIDFENRKCTVKLAIFGREIAMDIDLTHVKID